MDLTVILTFSGIYFAVNCNVNADMAPLGFFCTEPLSNETGTRLNYDIGWTQLSKITIGPPNRLEQPFWYYNEECSTVSGTFQRYCGGGYIAVFPDNPSSASQLIQSLSDTSWIDEYTKVVFVEFNLFNMNTNLFTFIRVTSEFPNLGGVFPTIQVESVRLYDYTGPLAVVLFAGQMVFLIFVLVKTILVIYHIVKLRKGFLKEPWKMFDVLILFVSYAAIILYTFRTIHTIAAVEEMKNNKGEY